MEKSTEEIKGSYLKEVIFSFKLKESASPIKTLSILVELIRKIGLQVCSHTINRLEPGFDVILGLKESHLVFSYWGDEKFVHMSLSSCKWYDENLVIDEIKKWCLELDSDIKVQLINDCKVSDFINSL